MKLLLDLHVFLWMILESHRLPATIAKALNFNTYPVKLLQ
jgi:PIN domain nuclease of toxin-antitoxin system